MMKSIILASTILSGLLSAPSVFGREALIKSYTIEAVNGGINPDFSGFKISAVVEAAAAGCEATRSLAKLKLVERSGEQFIVADVTPKYIARRIPCAPVPADFEGLKAENSFVVERAQFSTIKLANVTAMGQNLSINELFMDAKERAVSECADADETVFCTMEYNPTACVYGNRTIEGSNGCAARSRLKAEVCSEDQSFVPTAVVCRSLDSVEF